MRYLTYKREISEEVLIYVSIKFIEKYTSMMHQNHKESILTLLATRKD